MKALGRSGFLLLVVAACSPPPRTGAEDRDARALDEQTKAPEPPLSTPRSASNQAADVPADFRAKYSYRVEPGVWQVAETASPDCRSQCYSLRDDELRRLYQAFVRRAFDKMKTREIGGSPHRGGVCLEARWNGRTHEICDVTTTELEPRWRSDYDELCKEVLQIFLDAKSREADAGPANEPPK